MNDSILKIPKVTNYGIIATDELQIALAMHQPQIIQHLAFIPIETQNCMHELLKTISLIEEFKLEQDIIVKDSTGNYDSAVYQNNTDRTVIVPPATHLKGGKQNRGNNSTEILGENEERTIDVNCFEPSRGHGTSRFTEFEDTPADVAQVTMTRTNGYEGSWNMIREYTNLAQSGNALADFNHKTIEDRAKYTLNFETCDGQTGVSIITRDLSMIEIFPTPTVFNLHAQRILRGKTASLFYKIENQTSQRTLLLPSEVEGKVNEMIQYVQTGIKNTINSGTKTNGLIMGRSRTGNKAMDIVLTDTDPIQVAYIFGVW